MPLYRGQQRLAGVWRGSGDQFAAMVDGGGHAGIGGAQHGAAGFQCPRLRQLQVLAHGVALAEPGQIADVGQYGGVSRRADQFFAKAVFIADVECYFLLPDREGSLIVTARRKAGQWHVHEAVQPAGDGWQRDELAKRHQMILRIVVLRRLVQRDDGVEVAAAVGSAAWNAGD